MPRTNNSIRSIDLTRAILENPETGAFYYIKEGRLTTVVNREIGLEPVKYKVNYIKDLVEINHKDRLKNWVPCVGDKIWIDGAARRMAHDGACAKRAVKQVYGYLSMPTELDRRDRVVVAPTHGKAPQPR